MRSYILVAALATLTSFVAAAPVRVGAGAALGISANNHAIARHVRSSVHAETRQLAPGGLSNIDFDGIVDELTLALNGVVGITGDQVKTIINAVLAILQGEDVNDALAELLSVPSDILVRLPPVFTPILLGASTGLPGINNVVILLLQVLPQLGNDVSLLGRDTPLDLGGLDLGGLLGGAGGLGGLLGGVGSTLFQLELPAEVIELVTRLLRSLLGGLPVDPADVTALKALDSSVLQTVLGALPDTLSNLLGASLLGGDIGPIPF